MTDNIIKRIEENKAATGAFRAKQSASSVLTLGKSCAACGKERKSKYLMYDPETLKPYCENPYICNDEHPNSNKNLIKYQKVIQLIGYEDASEAFRLQLMESYKNDKDVVSRIQAILTKPSNIRIQDPELAKFLVEFQDAQGFDSLSETFRYCVQVVKDNRNQFINEHREAVEEHRKDQAAIEIVRELQSENKPATVLSQPDTGSFGDF